jgi:hypothetical protein
VKAIHILGCLTSFTLREYDYEMREIICDIDLAIDALGGNRAVAALAGVGVSAVSNWRARGAFPPRLFLRLSAASGKSGVVISEKLFREISNGDAVPDDTIV